MKGLTGIIYLTAGLLALYWAVQKTLVGMYGVPFSWWYAIVALGAVLLILGAVMFWVSVRPEALWLLRIGSGLLVVYFVPAIVTTIRQYLQNQGGSLSELALRSVMVLLAVVSLVLSIVGRRAS